MFRKNIIDAVEQGYKLEDLIVTIAGQRSPSLNTKFENKSIHLGYFNTEQEAYNARCVFEKENNIINKYL